MALNKEPKPIAGAAGEFLPLIEGSIPSSDKGIAAIVDLTNRAAAIDIVNLPTDGFGAGLPGEVLVLVDHRAHGQVHDLTRVVEAYRLKPRSKKGEAKALTLQSFIDLANRHKTADSAVFANTDWKGPSFTAVIDYHEARSAGAADNLKHRIAYAFPLSEEWKVWVKFDGETMDQGEFAAFLEDRIADLTAPNDHERIQLERDFDTKIATPAQLIQLSRGLQVNVESVVKNVINLGTGEASIQFDEQHTDGNGQPLKVPGLFMLAIAPFFMGEKITIPARLRYRKQGAKIIWFYQLYRPDLHVTERVRDDLDTVKQKTELPTFEGSPEA